MFVGPCCLLKTIKKSCLCVTVKEEIARFIKLIERNASTRKLNVRKLKQKSNKEKLTDEID